MTGPEIRPAQPHVLLDRFYACARSQPEAPAVIDGPCRYSYAQIHAWSTNLAELIRQQRVLPGEHVAVCAPRGAPGIVSLLAVLQAGAVYVPLNPELPAALLRQQVRTASIGLVLLQPSERSELANVFNSVSVQIVGDCPTEPINSDIATAPVSPDDRAYIIFTSGTTGEPKPVTVSLSNLFKHLVKTTDYYRIAPSDRVLQVCSPSFDIHLEEVLPSLCAGACVVVAPRLTSGGIDELNQFMCSQDISLVNMPTALWCTWVDWLSEEPGRFPPTLSRVIIGSEACPVNKLEQWLALDLLHVRCINAYGLTETTITSCAWELPTENDAVCRQHVPIGQPLPGVKCYVLDQDMQPCKPGAPGELYIGGDGVSLGYWGDTARTEARFLTDPFEKSSTGRMYRTGDQARLNQDGDLIVTGRVDRQIKLRGHRIEPEAIEHNLSRQPSIRQAVVRHCIVGSADRLIAYVIPESGHPVSKGRFYRRNENDFVTLLTMQLKQILPEYAIPTDYCALDRFPLTVNGKIDDSALPTPTVGRESRGHGESTHILTSCLTDVMGFAPDDLGARFFDVGGDSIIAIKIVANLRRAGYELALSDLMSAPSLHAVADRVRPLNPSARKAAPDKATFITALHLSRSELQQLHSRRTLWANMEFISSLTPLQIGMIEQSIRTPRAGHYIEQVEGPLENLDVRLFKQAWGEVIQRHEILRTYFCFHFPGKVIQICNKHHSPSWHELNWMDRPASRHKELIHDFILNDRSKGFAFTNQPPFRLQLIQLDSDEYHFLWTYHHALLDGWSDLLILDEVFSLYYATINGDKCILPDVRSFRAYVDYLHNHDMTATQAFWRDYFSDLSTAREWLVEELDNAEGGIAALHYTFGKGQTKRLSQYARRQGVTLNTLFLASCGMGLGLEHCFPEVVIGTLTAVRPEELDGVEHIAGLFLNLIPARLHSPGNQPLSVWLQELLHDQMKRRLNGHISTEDMVAAAGSQQIDHLFNAVLIFENYPDARNSTAARLHNHAQSAFPLNFYIWPGEELSIEVKYSRNFLSPSTAQGILERMTETLLSMPGAEYSRELFSDGGAEAMRDRMAGGCK